MACAPCPPPPAARPAPPTGRAAGAARPPARARLAPAPAPEKGRRWGTRENTRDQIQKKTETEAALEELKTALGGSNYEMIKSATEKVATVSQALGSALYAAGAAAEGDAAPQEDGVEDAEVVEEESK